MQRINRIGRRTLIAMAAMLLIILIFELMRHLCGEPR
jgi:hypothetical protein